VDSVSRGGTLLFVGTKQQARASVARHAKRCGSYFTTRRWLGGTLTNFSTIRKSIDRMKRLEELLNQANSGDSEVKLNKKERLTITRQLETLEGNIGGIRNMRRVPDVLFVIDVNKEHIAVAEAKRLGVAVIALVDTNVDPSTVEYAIPCNDDSTRAIDLLVASAADAVLEGLEGYESYKRENPRREESDVDATGKITEVSTRGSHGRRGHGSSGGKARNSSGGGDVKMGNSSVEPGQEPSGAGQALNDEGKSVITVSI
jgi:small subunit ribosomal protein S2